MNKEFEKIINRFKQLQGCDTLANMFINDVITEIKNIKKEYNNGWIAVTSGQLPKENEFYNVTIFDGEDYRTEPAYYAKIGYLGQKNIMPNWWTDCTSNAELIEEYDDKVVAWQPLPEPYQPKGE